MGKHYWVFECWQIANQSALSSSYLKSAVELTDIMLKLLEQYSSKNQFMFVRRKIKQKKKQGKVKKTRLLGWYLYCFKRYDNGSRSGWRRVWRWRTWNPSGISWACFQVWCFWKGKQQSLYPSVYTFSNTLYRNICIMTLFGYIVYFLSSWIPWNHTLSFVLRTYSIASWSNANVSRFSTR